MKTPNSIFLIVLIILSGCLSKNREYAIQRINEMGSTYDYKSFKEYIHSNNVNAAKLFLDAGMDPRGREDGSFLMWSAATGKYELAKLLIKYGADVNERLADGTTPLKLTCAHGHKRIFKLLIDNGAEVNNTFNVDEEGEIVEEGEIHAALNSEDIDILKYLIKLGANVNINNNLYWACKTGNLQVVNALLIRKCDFSEEQLNMGLIGAVESGNIQLVRLALEWNPDLNFKDEDNELTAIDYAIKENNQEIINLLRKHSNSSVGSKK